MRSSSANEPADGDAGRNLSTAHLVDDLRGHSVRGGAMTLSSQACKFVVALGTTATLARLLTPDDFGLLAMVMAFTGVVTLLKDLGLAKATVQRADITHDQISTLFWINTASGFVMTAATALLAPVIVWFYHEPRLSGVTIAMASVFVFGGLSVQHQAILQRQMRFGRLAAVEVLGPAIGAVVGIVSAVVGAGYWSLVALHVTTAAAMAVGVWIACRWRPGRPVRRSGVRPMLAYGGHLTGFSLIGYLARNVDKMLIGRYFASTAVGLYGKAYQLILLPVQQLNVPASGVAIATLSRLQNDPDRYRAYYRRGLELLVTLGMPAIALLFVTADRIVLLVLGPQWTDAVPIFRMLAPVAFLSTFNVATAWVYQSLGHTSRQLRWGAVAATVNVTACLIGLKWGPLGIAAALSTAVCLNRLPGILYCFHGTPIKLRDLGGAIWRPAVASAAAGCLVVLVHRVWPVSVGPVLTLCIDAVVFAVGYVGAWLLVPNGRSTLRGMKRLATEMLGSVRGGGSPG